MQAQKNRARNAAEVKMGDWVYVGEDGTESEFVGNDYTEHPTHIIKYREVQQKKRTAYEVILDKTPFYGEMGGEVGEGKRCGYPYR